MGLRGHSELGANREWGDVNICQVPTGEGSVLSQVLAKSPRGRLKQREALGAREGRCGSKRGEGRGRSSACGGCQLQHDKLPGQNGEAQAHVRTQSCQRGGRKAPEETEVRQRSWGGRQRDGGCRRRAPLGGVRGAVQWRLVSPPIHQDRAVRGWGEPQEAAGWKGGRKGGVKGSERLLPGKQVTEPVKSHRCTPSGHTGMGFPAGLLP